MKVSTMGVLGGWQTLMEFADGTEALVGPVFRDCAGVWNWQRANLFDVVDQYALTAV